MKLILLNKILKISKDDVSGKLATEVYGVEESPYFKEYSNLSEEEPRQFEVFFAPLKKYFSISVSPWGGWWDCCYLF